MNGGYKVRSLYYEGYSNRMIDEDGRIVNDIFRLVSPSIFYLWKKQRGSYLFRPKSDKNIIYEFVFPFENEEYWEEHHYM